MTRVTRFVLGANTVSWLMKGLPNVVARLKAATPENICLSAVTEAELLYGVAKRSKEASRRR
jgi:tRNA(fMet)-specific endonuclease VapC